MRNFLLELRRAGRDMARHPGISLLAIVSMGIGLAVNAVLLRPIAIQAPGELRRLWLKDGANRPMPLRGWSTNRCGTRRPRSVR
jgi:hypothetical protein